MVDEELTSSLAVLGQFMVTEQSLRETLQRVAALTVHAVVGADGAGVTWLVGQRPATVTAAGDFVRRIDEIQYTLDEGPCLEAYSRQKPILIEDLASQGVSHWPRFTPAALSHGLRAVLAVPLSVHGAHLGALNVYALSPGTFDQDSVRTAEVFAAQAAVVLGNAEAFTRAQETAVSLGEALASRAVIDMAKGIIMARTGCDQQEAFDQLRTISQNGHRKLREVAADLVAEVVAGRQPSASPHAERTQR